MYMQGTRNKGQILVIALLIMTALLSAGVIMIRVVLAEKFMLNLYVQKEKAFYVAEAGLEDAKTILHDQPSWFTDNPHNPDGDTDWIIELSTGNIKKFGQGSYKIVRESGKNIVYSVGVVGVSKVLLKINMDNGPFRAYDFEIRR